MSGPAASKPSGSPQIASMRRPMTRPRISSLEARSITAASGVRQRLWTKPATKMRPRPTGSERVWPKRRSAPNHAAAVQSMIRPSRKRSRLAPTRSEPASAPNANAAASQPRPDWPTA
jgi:hypothetical protein